MSLRYPSELNPSVVDYVVFTPEEYRTNKSYAGQDSGFAGAPSSGESIVLYMPNSTPAVGNENSWGDAKDPGPLGELKRNALISVSAGALTAGTKDGGGISGVVENVSRQMEAAKSKVGPAARQAALTAVGGQFNYTGSALLALQRGEIYNPNIELLYQGPTLRNFTFDYTFVPKTPSETASINQIIMAFKKASSAEANGGMLKVPNVWRVTYMTRGQQNPYMNAFKKAALKGVTVQHNNGTDMHHSFADGMPVVTSLQLSFQEVDIILKDDHDNSGSFQGY